MMQLRQCGVCSLGWVNWLFFTLLLLFSLGWPQSPSADQAQYVYDELGRLLGVEDGQGNVATYEYDRVGNLLSISRDSVTTPVIATSVPATMPLGTTTTLALTGTGLWPATVTVSNGDILAVVDSGTLTSLSVLLTIPTVTTLGNATVTVTTFGGTATTTIDIVNPLTTVSGTVVDHDGNAVADATIEILNSVVGVTTADGSFLFSGIATVLGNIQVKATGLVEGFQTIGVTAMFPPVPNGVTNVGQIQLPRPSGVRAVVVNNVDLTLNVINPFTLSIESSVPLPTTATPGPREVVVSGDGSTALVTVGHSSSIGQRELIFVDLQPTPPVVITSIVAPFSNFIDEVTLGCPRLDIALVSGFGAGPAAISVNLANQSIVSELHATISDRLVLLPPAGVHVLGRGGFSSLALAALDQNGVLSDTGTTLDAVTFGDRGLVVSPNGAIGLLPSPAGADEPEESFVSVVDIDTVPTVTFRDEVIFPTLSFAGPHSITFNTDGTKAYLLLAEAKNLGVLDVDGANNVTDSGLRVTDVGGGSFEPHSIAVLDASQHVLVRKQGVVTVIDQNTLGIIGTIPLPGRGGIATVGMECL